MSDDPMSRVPVFNRVSIRAVLVGEDEDPYAALAAAGIVNAVAIPVFVGEEVDLSGGLFGDGRTPNVTAVLETEQDDDPGSAAEPQPATASSPSDAGQISEPGTTNLPPAFGSQPLAPVRKSR